MLALVGARVELILRGGGRHRLRALIAKALSVKKPDTEQEMKDVRQGLAALEKERKRLVASLTPKNKETLDEEFVQLRRKRKELESRLEELQSMRHREVDIDAVVEEIMATMSRFEGLFEEGTLEEKKEFIRLFVDRIDLDPEGGQAKVWMKRVPVPERVGAENLKECVSGARYTHQKTNFPPIEKIDVQVRAR